MALVLAVACQPGPETRSGAHTVEEQVLGDEEKLLADNEHGVFRRGAELFIPLLRGDTLSFRDSIPDPLHPERDEEVVEHSYRAYLPSIGYHVVSLHFWNGEGLAYLLVNGRSGRTATSNGVPIVSPDNHRIAAANVDLDAQYNDTTLQIWRLESDSLALEWKHDFLAGGPVTDSTWGPSALRWLTPTEIRLTMEYAVGVEKRGESVVRLGPTGWRFAPP